MKTAQYQMKDKVLRSVANVAMKPSTQTIRIDGRQFTIPANTNSATPAMSATVPSICSSNEPKRGRAKGAIAVKARMPTQTRKQIHSLRFAMLDMATAVS